MPRKWVYVVAGILLGTVIGLVGLRIIADNYIRALEPRIRAQAIQYLEKRFDSKVEMGALRVHLPGLAPVKTLFHDGRGIGAFIEGEGVVLRHHGRRDIAPLFAVEKFRCDFDVGAWLLSGAVRQLRLEGLQIHIPPKGERTTFTQNSSASISARLAFERVIISHARLIIMPKNEVKRSPLDFEIRDLSVTNVSASQSMHYSALMTNPRPPGQIKSEGTFGPWNAEDPGNTPLSGAYQFTDADLGVFPAVSGILASSGDFKGSLSSIEAKGQADVPSFRLKRSGNPVALHTQFEPVDGQNGNTVLRPVLARLGSTQFRTSGAVIEHEPNGRRNIQLKVTMPDGDVSDLLKLAMKGEPFMDGRIHLDALVGIPPLSGKVREKLRLAGHFQINQGHFRRSTIQDQIDNLSRRGQGQPKNEQIDEVFSGLGGEFHMENETITFETLSFLVPGAGVDLTGTYDLDQDKLNFDGALVLDATVSKTLTGWKRWIAKPFDPLFTANGAGTYLSITIAGSAQKPKFSASVRRRERLPPDVQANK